MFDERLNERARDARMSEDPRALADVLLAKIRGDTLSTRVVLRAALYGSEAALLLRSGLGRDESEDFSQEEMNEVLRIVFGKIELAPRTREFLNNLVHHDLEARATLSHYELVQDGDKEPPDSATAMKALMDDLRSNQNHREAIAQMNRPVFQLVPVYDHEGAGFQRMVNAIDAHRSEALPQRETFVQEGLRNRWRMDLETSAKIVRWRVVVVEGEKELSEESNRFLRGEDGEIQPLQDQLNQWRTYCGDQALHLCERESYCLLQMQEIRQLIQYYPLDYSYINHQGFSTVLEDRTRITQSPIPLVLWINNRLSLGEAPYNRRAGAARFRPAVVIDIK